MPTQRYRLRHTRRVRQDYDTEQTTLINEMGDDENEENDHENADSVAVRVDMTDQLHVIENVRRQTPETSNQGRIHRHSSSQHSSYLNRTAEREQESPNIQGGLYRPHNSRIANDVRSGSSENSNMVAVEVFNRREFNWDVDEQELPSDVKYMRLQRGITPDIEIPKDDKKWSYRGHRRRSSSCDLNITFTRPNDTPIAEEETRDFKDESNQYFDPNDNTRKQSNYYVECEALCHQSDTNRDQIIEVTCRSASNSSTFYNILSYPNKTLQNSEKIKSVTKEECDKTNEIGNIITKRDAATNTGDSFDAFECDVQQTESGKVSQNSMASGKLSQISIQSGTTITTNEFEIPDWTSSRVSTPLGTSSSASDQTEIGEANDTIDDNVEIDKENKIGVIEVKFNPIKYKTPMAKQNGSTSKHMCTQTDSQNQDVGKKGGYPISDQVLESRDNVTHPKVDTWQRDWIPASEYKRNENFQVFSKYMHFDQIHAKVQTWKNNWEPACIKPRERINLNTNKDFLRALKHVEARIDTGTRNTVGNQWSRHNTQKTKIKSAPVNKKKPPCPLGPRRTRD